MSTPLHGERKKEHLNEEAHCLTEYLERLLHNTNYERNLEIEYVMNFM